MTHEWQTEQKLTHDDVLLSLSLCLSVTRSLTWCAYECQSVSGSNKFCVRSRVLYSSACTVPLFIWNDFWLADVFVACHRLFDAVCIRSLLLRCSYFILEFECEVNHHKQCWEYEVSSPAPVIYSEFFSFSHWKIIINTNLIFMQMHTHAHRPFWSTSNLISEAAIFLVSHDTSLWPHTESERERQWHKRKSWWNWICHRWSISRFRLLLSLFHSLSVCLQVSTPWLS